MGRKNTKRKAVLKGPDGDLREAGAGEENIFAGWEQSERPYPWTARQFLGTDVSRTLVWDEKGAPRGFASLQLVGEEAYLLNIMVDPALRRTGRGERMLQKVMIVARRKGASRMLLDVEAGNKPALALYQKAGFAILERRRRAYPRGEDALVMKKEL
jgi:[ribosomal protein S18]-alanine N-acetyltransferase